MSFITGLAAEGGFVNEPFLQYDRCVVEKAIHTGQGFCLDPAISSRFFHGGIRLPQSPHHLKTPMKRFVKCTIIDSVMVFVEKHMCAGFVKENTRASIVCLLLNE